MDEAEQKKNVEEMAETLDSLAKGVRALLGGRLKEETVVLLISESSKVSKARVRDVLNAIKTLPKTYNK